jgi:hypothetical protein
MVVNLSVHPYWRLIALVPVACLLACLSGKQAGGPMACSGYRYEQSSRPVDLDPQVLTIAHGPGATTVRMSSFSAPNVTAICGREGLPSASVRPARLSS